MSNIVIIKYICLALYIFIHVISFALDYILERKYGR